ncbi:PTS cellobiose transporter subunit IIA [Salisediminibacterium halotolerans]|uniref:PTS cellobiose transporter subunit IIA n=1 Tax=Salisediminibacterium halotolerans TaxID=517425 RepID=UPI000EACDEC4|nr:PTS cellobiose transporter subunit IIA [Salisediminibacterium halotolerans]RLJ75688.1 PTS system cellobiose-specific IIA component [Actinophytocola xinjiangensis]RPE89542.1 PTS system cellobiose-specific IIA component [Salisediminibacterium halotolerans]TWG36301.1 PTS system cellobiose-specific IIA component [Salisediminibacterium halotolerans]GEL09164.1 PTS cellobiose transporter subunit IIA [Salisediminibacterium halotolerans]
MEQEELQTVAFQIILHSGSARTSIQEAFTQMRNGEYREAEKKLEEANEEIVAAHKSQTELLQKYSHGETITVEIIMVHAQDHLMNVMTLKDMAEEMIHLHEKVDNK